MLIFTMILICSNVLAVYRLICFIFLIVPDYAKVFSVKIVQLNANSLPCEGTTEVFLW